MDIACPSCTAPYEIDDASVTEAGRKVRCANCGTVWRVYPALAASTVAPVDPTLAMDPGANPFATEPPEDIFGDGGPRPLQSVESASAESPSAETALPVESTSEPQVGESPPDDGGGAVSVLEQDLTQQDLTQGETTVPLPSRARLTKDRKPVKEGGKGKSRFFTWKTGAIAAALAVLGVGIHQREATVRFMPQTAVLYRMIGLPVNLRGIEIKGVASRMLDDNGVQILVIDGDLQNVSGRKVDVPRLRFAVRGNDGQEIYVWSAQADKASLQPGETLNFRRRLAAPPNDGRDVSVRFLTRSDTTGGLK
jgi:predicted Zn finger-like uncharacterized protein